VHLVLLLSDLDDAALAARIANGDEAAFVVAYDRHASFVFSSVARFLGDRETAGEVVQDAFVTLWRRARQFDAGSGSLLTWLLAIARHRAIDRLRAEGRRPGRDAISLDTSGPDGRNTRSGDRRESPPELVADAATDPTTIASRRWVQSVSYTHDAADE
jgi:RNA polymerase sigma factor (sigma-70 family)